MLDIKPLRASDAASFVISNAEWIALSISVGKFGKSGDSTRHPPPKVRKAEKFIAG